MLEDRDEAASAVQDAFFKAFRVWRKTGFSDLVGPGQVDDRIAVNTCWTGLRSRRWQFWRAVRRRTIRTRRWRWPPDWRPSAEDRVLAREIGRRLAEAVRRSASASARCSR